MRVDYREYLKSPYWKALRRRTLIAADYRCRICSRTDMQLHVHHLTYDRLGHERPEDLVVLCAPCHADQHDLPYVPRGNRLKGQPEPLAAIVGRALWDMWPAEHRSIA